MWWIAYATAVKDRNRKKRGTPAIGRSANWHVIDSWTNPNPERD